MAKETRDITQYKFYTLIHKVTDRESQRVTHEPVAIFDDIDLVPAYVEAQGWTHDAEWNDAQGFDSYLQSEWTAVEPVVGNFNLPFNPVAEATE